METPFHVMTESATVRRMELTVTTAIRNKGTLAIVMMALICSAGCFDRAFYDDQIMALHARAGEMETRLEALEAGDDDDSGTDTALALQALEAAQEAQSDVDELDVAITALSSDLQTLQSDVLLLEFDTAVAATDAAYAVNEANQARSDALAASTSAGLAYQATLANDNDIVVLFSADTVQAGNIVANATAIATNTTEITANTAEIAANLVSIAANASDVANLAATPSTVIFPVALSGAQGDLLAVNDYGNPVPSYNATYSQVTPGQEKPWYRITTKAEVTDPYTFSGDVTEAGLYTLGVTTFDYTGGGAGSFDMEELPLWVEDAGTDWLLTSISAPGLPSRPITWGFPTTTITMSVSP